MASKAKGRLPIVTVIHYDVGPDRSISVEEFLRSLKRVPHPSFSERRTQKRKPCSRILESPAHTPASTRNKPFLVGHDDPGISNPVDQVDEVEQPCSRNRTPNTTQDTTDLGYRSHAVSAAATPGCLDLDRPTSSESRPLKDIHTYSSRKRQSRQTPCREGPPPKQKKTRRRCASPSELPLIDTIEGTTGLNRTPSQQLQGQKPMSEIRQDIRLSKSRVVDPAEFKFPPVTPSTTRRATWRLGSGFKRRSRRPPSIGGRSSPDRERRKVNLDTSAPPIQATSTAFSNPGSPGNRVEEVPAIHNVTHVEMPQTQVTGETTGG
ncbi:MAG: hypothetical protein L6R42_001135 [Xanthoria sp. 1 TBL-2021]|nr:MAG: hypothetical protein L6R42_001135 [Xanthoria sp. 1 TBL-2021]